MVATEFEIVVSDRTVSCIAGPVGALPTEYPDVDLIVDELSMDTVALMDQWLNFYSLITSKGQIRHAETLFEPKTFQVVGRQLWKLILHNDVGDLLVRHLEKPEHQPLRLVLTFTDDADADLRGLPWEFLYHPRYGFLAGRTGLLLTRYVQHKQSNARPSVTMVKQDQLRVLTVAALPDDRKLPQGERHFSGAREDLKALWDRLKTIDQLDPLEPILAWDDETVSKAVSVPDKPCHIVHVMGICKGAPGQPRLLLGGGGDGFQSPQTLVDGLTASTVPQLVILQLCDYWDGDASENFERLAPALIEKGVPAVLALQYAAPADEVGVGEGFYRSLVDGKAVGEAVQASRATLAKKVDRRFATPVLYLGNDGVLWDKAGSLAQQPRARSQPNRPGGRSGEPADVKTVLARVVQRDTRLDDSQKEDLIGWVIGLPLGDQPVTAAMTWIRLKVKDTVDLRVRDALRRMIGELLGQEQAS